jgi:thymidylate synthase
MQAEKTIVVDNIDQALTQTLELLIDHGTRIKVGGVLSTAAGRTTLEVLNYSIRVTNPRNRFPANPEFRFNPVAAVARFVWMMSGSDRVSDIAHYQPRSVAFSDDGLIIPGSSYGRRFLAPRPGLNQLAGVIDRLKDDAHSRRAFLSIYQPEDAVRISKDIPCLLTLGYHIRNHQLYATTSMRANNACSLFAYNFFEFSLLADIIAKELGVELGPLTHSAVSMHIYEEEIDRARAIVRAGAPTMADFDHIELSPTPLADIRALIELEPLARTLGDCDANRLTEILAKANQCLTKPWKDMFRVLAIHSLLASNKTQEAGNLVEQLDKPWGQYFSPRAKP